MTGLIHRLPMLVLATVATVMATMMPAEAATGSLLATDCALVAAPTGSDSAAGTTAAPFRTAQRLIDAVGPGRTGCLRTGTYSESLRFNHGGAAGAPVTLTSYPGERATVVGRFYVPRGSNYVTVTSLNLDGTNASNLPSPTVNSSDVTFRGNDVTNNHRAICFMLGSDTWGIATRTIIERNRIHGCGRRPSTNLDHGIYLAATFDVNISWNLIYDNTDRGIQLYPNAQRTTITHNVIDGNGEGIIFSGDSGLASSGNTVAYNVISNAAIRWNVESWYPAGNPRGLNNIVSNNCIWAGAAGGITTADGGFVAQGNMVMDPQFGNRLVGDFRMPFTSVCALLVGDVMGVVTSALAL